MPYEAKVLAHSVSTCSRAKPLITMQLRYPRFLHAEELTHRILNTSPEQVETVTIPDGFMYDRNLSRNASSSRAIPVPRLIEDIRRDPAEPLFWGKNQPGMQAAEELDPDAKPNFRTLTVSTAAKPQNSAVLLDDDRIVVLKIRCPFGGFSTLTASATMCWHSGSRRSSRSTERRKSRFYRDFCAVTCSNSPYQPRKVWCLKNLRH
jgi:hypothetical protein